jgi:hypothetical protein
MAELKLLRIEEGDSQKNLVDKVNSNFSSLITFGGGPYGRVGAKGPRGAKGIKGPQGSFGDLGTRGSIWTIGPTQPGITGSISGDWWLDTENQNLLNQFSTTNTWVSQGFNLNGFDLFSVQGPLSSLSGLSDKFGYFFSSNTPADFTFLMSDNPAVISGTESSPNPLPNPQYSKFVISVDGSDPTKNILEFNKAPYVSTGSYNSGSPRFFWDQGATASRGNYGLKYINGSKTIWDFSSSSIDLRSTSSSVSFKSTGFNTFLNSSSIFAVNSAERIDLNFVGGTATFSSKNFSYGSDLFTISSRFNVNSNPTIGFSADPGFKITSTNSQTGNFRYIYNAIPNSNASLLKSTQSGGLLFGVFGDGYFYYDKRVNSIQNQQTITETTSSTVSATTVNWTTVIPSISVNSGSGNFYYASNGIDYIISKSPSAAAGERGICLWTPATGGSVNNNSGWLNLIENEEAISFRVHSSSSDLENFRFIGLNTSLTQSAPPNNTVPMNYSYADLGSGVGASTVDFTIINITGTGSNAGNIRWFRVYYSAWGGNLTTPQCGILQTYNSTA